MTKSRSKIQVQIKDGELHPVTLHDAQQIEEFSQGTVFNITRTAQRSNPQHNLYWATLAKVCKSTGRWPTSAHLHNELKWACGYVRMRWNSLASAHMRMIDSINFDEMDQKEFHQYFDMAMEKLAEAIGHDPLEI